MTDLSTAQPGDRVTVKPAHAGALIPDPAHNNCLAPEGTEVVWDHYWIGRREREEIVGVEVDAPASGAPEDADSPASEVPAEAPVDAPA